MKIFLCLLLLSNVCTHAETIESLVVQKETRVPQEPLVEAPDGSTEQILADWAQVHPATPVSAPDHTYNSVWVRMFPLLTAAQGDPYGPTQDKNNIDINNDQNLDIYTVNTQLLIGTTPSLHFDFTKSTFLLNGVQRPLQPFWIVPHNGNPSTLQWDQGMKLPTTGTSTAVTVELRGGFLVQPSDFTSAPPTGTPPTTQTLWAVTNVVDVDSYLQAVVPSEADPTWEPAALQAQAIAARTYGMFQVVTARAANRNWDLDPTTWFQSYRGVEFLSRSTGNWLPIEHATSTAAVAATSGQIVTYNSKVIQAFFSANSGGRTCSVNECFNQPNLPYFISQPDASGVTSVAGGTWGSAANLTPAAIRAKLLSLGINPASTVKNLAALKVGASGRTWQLRVHLTSGAKTDLTSAQTTQLMALFGPIRSYLYTLGTVSNGKQSVVGHGYGHGVGMSQWGAQLFAKQGWSAQQIINYFYVNTTIQTVTGGQVP